MPKVLIAGCGYLGRATADLFYRAEWTVEAWRKTPGQVDQPGAESYPVAAVDIGDRGQVADRPGEFDIVIHCASTRGGDADSYRTVYLNGVSNLRERFSGSTIILVGSTSVYAQRRGEWVTEESEAEPQHERGKILRQAERIVLDRTGIVARLGGIYGPGRSYLLNRLLSGQAVMDALHDRFINQVHRDDAATALLLLATTESLLRGQIFNVTDNQPILQSECFRWLAQQFKRPIPPAGKSPSSGKRGRSNKRVSNAKLRGLGWAPKFPIFADGILNSVLENVSSSAF